MEILIIILIVTMIVQTGTFVYSNFIDLSSKRQADTLQTIMKNQHADFVNEKQRYEFVSDQQQKLIKTISRQRDSLAGQVQLLKKYIGRTKENPVFEEELMSQVSDIVNDYMERGVEFADDHSVDLSFAIETDSKKYDVLLQVTETEKKQED